MPNRVTVTGNARLHMGFLDLHGGLGRRFGSIGVSLQGLQTTVSVSDKRHGDSNSSTKLSGESARADRYVNQLLAAWGSNQSVQIDIHNAIRPHAGLGSGTQLALAVGLGVSRLLNRHDTPEDIAIILGRGKRSAIGLSCFKQGGFVIDGGKGQKGRLPPALLRLPYPSNWRLILLFDGSQTGMHGDHESNAFAELEPLPASQAAHLCRLILMRLLPGLVEQDVQAFGAAVTEIQEIVGDHFAPAQGGRFTSPRVSRWLNWFAAQGVAGVGQSSWGPTGFVVCESQEQAQSMVNAASRQTMEPVDFHICEAMNQPGTIELH